MSSAQKRYPKRTDELVTKEQKEKRQTNPFVMDGPPSFGKVHSVGQCKFEPALIGTVFVMRERQGRLAVEQLDQQSCAFFLLHGKESESSFQLSDEERTEDKPERASSLRTCWIPSSR
jgi:hypothetical protein